jgi:hypothetical protein
MSKNISQKNIPKDLGRSVPLREIPPDLNGTVSLLVLYLILIPTKNPHETFLILRDYT